MTGELEINFHGPDFVSVIRNDWSDFSADFIQKALSDYIESTDAYYINASRYNGYDLHELQQIKSYILRFSAYVVQDDINDLTFSFPEGYPDRKQLAEICTLLWFAYENVSIRCWSPGNDQSEDFPQIERLPFKQLLQLYTGFFIFHTGEEQNILMVAKSPALEYPQWYAGIRRS